MHNLNDIKNMYPDVDVNEDDGADSYREGLPVIERDPVTVIIKHPTENMYLVAQWKGVVWNGFLTGGIEDGDSLETTVKKEIHEETGFKHVSRIVPMDCVSHALFFHPVKKVNRLAHYHLVFAELMDLEKNEVSEMEKNIADFVWVPYEEVLEMLTRNSIKSLWKFYMDNKVV